MKQNYDIKPGQDKFLQLHINDLSKLTLNETKRGSNNDLTPVIVSATITGFIFGVIAAYLIGLLP